MKKVHDEDEMEMPEEVDFSTGVRGRYAGRLEPMENLVLIEPEIFRSFPSAAAVNDALRLLKKAAGEAVAGAQPGKRTKAS